MELWCSLKLFYKPLSQHLSLSMKFFPPFLPSLQRLTSIHFAPRGSENSVSRSVNSKYAYFLTWGPHLSLVRLRGVGLGISFATAVSPLLTGPFLCSYLENSRCMACFFLSFFFQHQMHPTQLQNTFVLLSWDTER